MSAEHRAVSEDQLRDQVERILHSEGFRSSEVLRRLLHYLADKSIAGSEEHLKEYVVAVEGMGKNASYDPKRSSSVRIQAGRLRQRLAEYYSDEGKDDPVLIELARGSFRLTARLNSAELKETSRIPELDPLPSRLVSSFKPPSRRLFSLDFLLGVAVGVAILAGGWYFSRSVTRQPRSAESTAGWTPDLQALWGPFVKPDHPLIVSIEDPLFLQLNSNPGVFYRDRSINEWADARSSPAVRTIAVDHTGAPVQPSRYFTSFGEVEVSLLLGRLLGPQVQILTLSRSSQLTLTQMENNDVLFVGVQYNFFKQIQDLPVQPQLNPTIMGIIDSHAPSGGAQAYLDQYTTAPVEQGITYALVTRLPGPSRSTEVESFSSNHAAGYLAAVQWFANPNSASLLVQRLKNVNGGKMPRFYQVLLRVTCKEGVPTEISYVLGRVLQ